MTLKGKGVEEERGEDDKGGNEKMEEEIEKEDMEELIEAKKG